MTIQNKERLQEKFSVMDTAVKNTLTQSVGREIKNVTADAKMRCSALHGELRQSITDRVDQYDERVTGTSYTNKDYAPYVEFGTGPNGEASHEGISPVIDPAYVQQGWMMPADAMSREEAEDYGLVVVEKGGEVIGYLTNGQAAQPFMYPALKDQEEKISRNLQAALRKELKRL